MVYEEIKYPLVGKANEITYNLWKGDFNMELQIFQQPKYLSKLYITKDMIYFFTYKKPNMWLRFWQYTFLGWKWEDTL